MINEQELDVPIRRLVRALNAFPGIRTRGSCGGHDNPGTGQWPAGTWYVTFEVDRTDHGWFSLEFLAWLINNDYGAAGHHVTLYPTSAPPYLNQPGQCLHFALEGYDGENADELAAWIDELHAKYFIPPKSVKHARASTRQRSKRQG